MSPVYGQEGHVSELGPGNSFTLLKRIPEHITLTTYANRGVSREFPVAQDPLYESEGPDSTNMGSRSNKLEQFQGNHTPHMDNPPLKSGIQTPPFNRKWGFSYLRILVNPVLSVPERLPHSRDITTSNPAFIAWLKPYNSGNYFNSKKLFQRLFRNKTISRHAYLSIIHISAKYENPKLDRNDDLHDMRVRLLWMIFVDKLGLTMVQDAPREPGAAVGIINKVGFVKPTHYGVGNYVLQNIENANSLAYTDRKLGMHNDLPYYNHVPGMDLLFCMHLYE
ncbi:unnamed protein product, partial [Meganyctiphanes norvegica]